jgi:hypothetical protein
MTFALGTITSNVHCILRARLFVLLAHRAITANFAGETEGRSEESAYPFLSFNGQLFRVLQPDHARMAEARLHLNLDANNSADRLICLLPD